MLVQTQNADAARETALGRVHREAQAIDPYAIARWHMSELVRTERQ